MSEAETQADDVIERLVRQHLERGAERIDPRPVFDRLQAAWPAPAAEGNEDTRQAGSSRASTGARRRFPAASWAWGLSAAAAVLLLVTGWLWRPSPVLASPESLVREAKKAHRMPLDRCYIVEVRKDSALYDECFPLTSQVRLTRLWTRGDRFWIESSTADRRWNWGRDPENRVWFAFEPHRAVRLEASEVPRWLNLCCDLYCIRLEQLLGTVLRDFALERETPGRDDDSAAEGAPATQVVRAMWKPGRFHPSIKSAVLEIDAESRVVRRMTIERMYKGQPFATVTCTLVETETLDDGNFQLEGHLTAPYTIYTRDFEPERRRELIGRWFRPEVGSWFRLPAPNPAVDRDRKDP
jgi:hypothetical protein